jgi:hypothetical protein
VTAAAWSQLVAAADADPAVVGLVLTGGRGKAVSTHRSDWDGLLVVSDTDLARWRAAVPAGLDVSVVAASDWTTYAEPGTTYSWRAYDLAHLTPAIDHGGFIEVQGTAEGAPFDRALLDQLLDLATAGCSTLTGMQQKALAG